MELLPGLEPGTQRAYMRTLGIKKCELLFQRVRTILDWRGEGLSTLRNGAKLWQKHIRIT